MGGKIEGVGKKLMPVSAAVTGLGVASVKTAADFESGMSKVAAISGAAGDEMDALSKKAREMGAKTKFSASEAASAMEYMAMAGWKTEDMLGGIEGVMNLAAASGEDLAATSDIVTDALTAFGLSAQDSGHFADVLAAASSNANTNVIFQCEHECQHDGRDVQVLRSYCRCPGVFRGGYGGGHRTNGECRHQGEPGRYGSSYHHE